LNAYSNVWHLNAHCSLAKGFTGPLKCLAACIPLHTEDQPHWKVAIVHQAILL